VVHPVDGLLSLIHAGVLTGNQHKKLNWVYLDGDSCLRLSTAVYIISGKRSGDVEQAC
jgi:hypothetical protein